MLGQGKSILSFLNPLFEPIVIIDENRKPLYWNHYFCTFSKSSPRILKNLETIDDLFISKSIDLADFYRESISKNETQFTKEILIDLPNSQETFYTVVLKLVPLPQSSFFMLCINDLTVERNVHEKYKLKLKELSETHKQIIQSDKLSSLGQLTASISHEISNPLTIAAGSTEILEVILEKDNINSEKEILKEKVKDVQDSLNRIQKIMSNMKFFLHKSEEGKGYHSLDEIIQGAVSIVGPAFEAKEVALKTEINTSNKVALINPTKIEQVLINLLKNSLDSVLASLETHKEVCLILDFDVALNRFLLSVDDNGVGLGKQDQEKVFEPFFTTKPIGEGTGLGLAISHKIMEEHDGEIIIDSAENQGATFTLSFPGLENASFAEHSEQWEDQKEGNGIKILVVDDEPQILNILREFLSEENYIFIGSTKAEEALKFLDKIRIDLVITDFNMPGMDGSMFISEVRKTGNSCPILYLTSKEFTPQFKQDQIKFDIAGLILKPFTKKDVIEAIRTTLLEKAV